MGADAVLDANRHYDFSLDAAGDIATADQLDTALLMSLFCERRASASEVPHPQLRRGWIGNEGTDFELGSKLWLYEQARLTRTTLNSLETEVMAGLQWLVTDGIALRVTTTVSATSAGAQVQVGLHRPNSEVVNNFYLLWEGTGRGT